MKAPRRFCKRRVIIIIKARCFVQHLSFGRFSGKNSQQQTDRDNLLLLTTQSVGTFNTMGLMYTPETFIDIHYT